MWIQNHTLVNYADHRARYVSQLSFEVNKFSTTYIRAQRSRTAFPVMALECQYKERSYNNSFF